MAEVKFEDFSFKVENAIEGKVLQFLEEAASEVESAARRNSRVDNGQLKGSWTHIVDESAKEATIGSPLENAIWEELGTGEYAVNGDGRKGGWVYRDGAGDYHHTMGKKPNHTLQRAFDSKKGVMQKRAEQIFGELDNE